jgi:hypothetical protein
LGSLAPLKSKGPLLVFADNYIYAMDANEQIPIASRDVTQSLLLFVRGLTEFICDLEQIVVVGAPIRNQDDKTTSYLIELLYDDCQKELEELGFEGDLAFIQSKKSRKGFRKSRHDRHIFTTAGQLVVTDSLRIFKSGRPHLTDTLTMTYRQYTDASSRSGIKLHAETLAHQLSTGQRLSVVGSLNEALIARALEQLCA